MKDAEVVVSVLCITYNHQKYIRRCLDSLVCQKTDFPFEIIVHDDASTDGTQEVIREYADRHPDRIIPVLQEKNQYSGGHDFIKEFMFPVVSGKYIVECEGDDYWCDDRKLQMQVDALEKHPGCVLCVHDTDTEDTDGNRQDLHFPMMRIEKSLITTDELIEMTLDENSWPFHLSAFMVRTELFKAYLDFKTTGFPSNFYRVGDLPLYLYFALKGDTYYIKRTMSVYTVESGGFMSAMKKDPQFARRVHQGYIDGLTAFDAYSGHRYAECVRKMLVNRRFEVARIDRRFDTIVRTPEFRPEIRKRGLLKAAGIYLFGSVMLLAGVVKKKGHKQ